MHLFDGGSNDVVAFLCLIYTEFCLTRGSNYYGGGSFYAMRNGVSQLHGFIHDGLLIGSRTGYFGNGLGYLLGS